MRKVPHLAFRACKKQQQHNSAQQSDRRGKKGLNHRVVSLRHTANPCRRSSLCCFTTRHICRLARAHVFTYLAISGHACSVAGSATAQSTRSVSLLSVPRQRREMKYFYTRVDRIVVVVAFTAIRKEENIKKWNRRKKRAIMCNFQTQNIIQP